MLDAKLFHEIVSGRRRGLAATLARATLAAAELPYEAGVQLRNLRFDRSHSAVTRVAVPVISVGNLTLGGTGKTPMIAWLANWFRAAGRPPAIVSRGYGAEVGKRNDEALELEQQLKDIPHLQNPDRVAGAKLAVKASGCDVILLDDGFQHRRLHRDLDIVLLDATCPFGHGRVFPRGTLREPIIALRRAHVVVLTRADLISVEQRNWVRAEVERVAPYATWVTARHAATQLISPAGDHEALRLIHDQRVLAFCGIGNPAAFRRTLSAIVPNTVGFREFPDHHEYTAGDIEALLVLADKSAADALVCTHKDIVKIQPNAVGALPLWAVGVQIEFLEGWESLERQLRPWVVQDP